jgi:hypothetical protein
MFLPKFDDPFLKDFARSLKKRLKRMEQLGYRLSSSRKQEQGNDGRIEKIELSAEYDGIYVDLFLWANREIWINAFSESSSGFQWEGEGRLIGSCGARLLVQAFETSLADANEMAELEAFDANLFNDNWHPLIAQGPQAVGD